MTRRAGGMNAVSTRLHRTLTPLAVVLFAAACSGPPPPAATPPSSDPSATVPASAPVAATASPVETPALTLIQFADSTDPSAAAESELELARQLRAETGMPALLGASGEQAFAELERLEEEFAQGLIRDVAAAIDAGGIPHGTALLPAGLIASVGEVPPTGNRPLNAIDVSLFADTGFTASAIMSMYAQIIQQAAQSQNGTLPRSETFDKTTDGLRQQVDLSTSFTVQTGGGRVSADIIMSATDRITDAATGSFVALYTSRTVGHFDVNACPDEAGVAEGTYTFETKHELNDVSGTEAARSAAGRAVEAPFRLINGDDAHLRQIEAAFDMQADGRGPGSPGGPGPTAPFDWGATQQMQVVMPVNGPTTFTGVGTLVTGTGGERGGGAMLLSQAMAQLFLAQVGREAEAFWRKGECITINTSDDTRKVDPSEDVTLTADPMGRFDQEPIDAPVTASFSGKKSLQPADSPVDPPATFDFTAGTEEGDKGTIKLEQVGRRGIGRKTVDFTVAPSDYRVTALVPGMGGFTGTKCDGLAGGWTLDWSSQGGGSGTTTFTLDKGGGAVGQAVSDYRVDAGGGASSHWKLKGIASVSRPDDGPAILHLDLGRGTVTVTAQGQSFTSETAGLAQDLDLEQGAFCD